MARPEWCPQCDSRRLGPALVAVPQPPAPPTPEQIAREVLAWLLEGKEIGLHAVAVKLALSRQDDEFCRRWAERARAYLRETGQEDDVDTTDSCEPPAPPTLREIEDALLAWAIAGDTRELRNGDPVCMVLLGIVDRLVKSRARPTANVEAPSRPDTPSGVVNSHPAHQEGAGERIQPKELEVALQRWVELADGDPDDDYVSYVEADEALEALARKLLVWPERKTPLALAREVLQHLNDWATMDPAAEPFGWIANETAAALERLK